MAQYKYQFSMYNLFDYIGVERHLEKMAAKGWQFDSVGSFFWKYKKAEPAQLKYSVTYIPEVSEYDPAPLEKQKDMEAYCEEAGWRKVGNLLQMQIFCSEHPEAVPIETEEELRLEYIHKSMKKNFLTTHLLLFLVFLLNLVLRLSMAKNDWVNFFTDGGSLWTCGIFLWGILLLGFDAAYYFSWMHRAKGAVVKGEKCPEPKGYRHLNRLSWCVLVLLMLGLLGSYTSGMFWFMLVYLTGIILVVVAVRKLQKKLKKQGVSKGTNVAVTMGACVLLSFCLVRIFIGVLIGFDIRLTEKREETGTILINGREWKVYQDTLPLYIADFAEPKFNNRSCEARVQSSFLASYGEYEEYLFAGAEVSSVTVANWYRVIDVKAEFLFDFLLHAFFEREFRHAEDGEREKTEYRALYEGEEGTLYGEYYEGLPVHGQWLVLTEHKIVPITLYLDELTEEQMKIIVDKFAE